MKPSLKRYGFQAMGVPCEIQIYDSSRINARNLIQTLAEEVARLDRKYSRYRRASFINDINRSAGNKLGVRLDRESLGLFRHALSCFEQSEGLFDVTAGVLYRLWDFRLARIPDDKTIAQALDRVGFHRLSWRGNRIIVPRGMEIDLGGIVKEYAADAAAKLARKLGIEHGLINLGGDFAVIGPQPEDRPWTVGIANPTARNTMMARIDLSAGGLASSGDYERYFEVDGKRYSHILNPKTGWPSSGLRAISVSGNLCTVAGSIATIAMLKEEQDAINWLQQTGLPHVYMRADGSIAGPGLKADDQEPTTDSQVNPAPSRTADAEQISIDSAANSETDQSVEQSIDNAVQ